MQPLLATARADTIARLVSTTGSNFARAASDNGIFWAEAATTISINPVNNLTSMALFLIRNKVRVMG